jgi:hypothetical protein
LLQQKEMKDLLGQMHVTKDTRDIDKSKTGRYTFSRLSQQNLLEKQTLDEYHFKNMKPMDDFVRPDDTSAPRHTGYEHGHIRSLFKLDTYGPSSSKESIEGRNTGKLPPANIDRYARLSPDHKLSLTNGLNSSRASTSHSTVSHLSHSSAASRDNSTTFGTEDLKDYLDFDTSGLSLDLTIPSSLRRHKDNRGKSRITRDDRLSLDPFVRRKQYFNDCTERKKVYSKHHLHLHLVTLLKTA